MIVGLVEKLEKMMGSFRDEDSNVGFGDVMKCVVESVAVGDSWYVPVFVMEEGMNETDVVDGGLVDKLPMFCKHTLTDQDGSRFFCAFTSEEAMNADSEEGTRISVKYAARAMLRDLLSSEECEGIVMNPWTDSVIISRENAEKVLDVTEHLDSEYVRTLRAYQIDPIAVIDTNAILREWRENWHDEEGVQEDWELVCNPIMPNGHVLLLFRMKDEIRGGKHPGSETVHTCTHCRVLEYEIKDGVPQIRNRYRFKVQDAHVGTVMLHDGVLRAAVSQDDSEAFDILQVYPADGDKQFTVYANIDTMVTDSSGNVAVAYVKNLKDPARCPLMVFNPEGEAVNRYHDEETLVCLDVNLDCEESVWFHLRPSATLDRLVKDSNRVESHKLELQGFDSFALSTDRSKLFVEFSEYQGGSAHFVMTADENGNYGNALRFRFLPENEKGVVLEAKDCEVFGRASAMKSWVILNADGRLYWYDIDDCCEQEQEKAEE